MTNKDYFIILLLLLSIPTIWNLGIMFGQFIRSIF